MLDDLLDTFFDDQEEILDSETDPEKEVPQGNRRKPGIRKDLVESVREKLRKGYYNSEPVLHDLSHEFARALNQKM